MNRDDLAQLVLTADLSRVSNIAALEQELWDALGEHPTNDGSAAWNKANHEIARRAVAESVRLRDWVASRAEYPELTESERRVLDGNR